MTREVDFTDGVTPVTADWLDSLQEINSAHYTGLHVDRLGTNVRVQASAVEPVGLVINGKMRYSTADKTVDLAGQNSGIYNVFATADTADRNWALVCSTASAPAGATNFRKIAEATWDLTAGVIRKIKQTPNRAVAAKELEDTGKIEVLARAPELGEMIADGSAISRSLYADLFAKIGTQYGGGDGLNTFNIPDYRGRTIVGVGTQAYVDARGDSDGLAVGSRGPNHAHTPPSHYHNMYHWHAIPSHVHNIDHYHHVVAFGTGMVSGSGRSFRTDGIHDSMWVSGDHNHLVPAHNTYSMSQTGYNPAQTGGSGTMYTDPPQAGYGGGASQNSGLPDYTPNSGSSATSSNGPSFQVANVIIRL